MTKVRIFEVNPIPGGQQPTGREILMDSDSPFFSKAVLGDMGKRAIDEGHVAIDSSLFQQLHDVVRSANAACV
jgi:hypothetical protein